MTNVRSLLEWCLSYLTRQPSARSPHFEEVHNLINALQESLTTVCDPVTDIEQFHTKFGLAYSGKPQALTGELAAFRIKFLKEEIEEYEKESLEAQLLLSQPLHGAGIPQKLELMLDALVDEVYVAIGTAYLQGFNFREAWRRVHAANMLKVRAERAEQSKRGTTFDVIKPEGWKAPSHLDLVEDHAHRKAK